MDLSVRRWSVKWFHRDWLSVGVSIHKNQYLNCFFSIKNNIYFVCEFWDHCIYESPHISSMAAWRWFNMARRGTQHWSLPTVWGKVSSRLALYAGKPPSSFMTFEFLFSVCLSFSFMSFCLTVIFVYTVIFFSSSKKRLMTVFDMSFYYFWVFSCFSCFPIYIWVFLFFSFSTFKPQKIILHVINTIPFPQNNQQLHSTIVTFKKFPQPTWLQNAVEY